METLSSEFTVAQKKLEHEFTQFNKAMMAHELEPVLAFKESLEQAQGRMSDCRQALDNAIERKSGDSLQFTQWRVSFETLMSQAGVSNDQKFYYLQQSLSGPALECIQDMFLLDSSTSYPIAMKRLMQRFGDPYIVSHAFHERLTNWARISDHDVSGLRKYSDFVQQCLVAQTLYPNLNILDHEKENNHIVSKLPDKLVHSWIRIVSDYKRKYGTFPSGST